MRKYLPTIIVTASFALMFLLVRILCDPVMSGDETVFAFNDGNLEAVISLFHYPEILLRCWDNQAFFGAGNGAMTLSLNAVFESVFGAVGFRRSGVLATIFLTALASFWTMRQFRRSIYASIAAAVLFLLCGWNFSFPPAGLPVRSMALMWSLLSVGMIEKARRSKSLLLYAAAGGILGLAMAETLDVGAIFAIACGGYFFLSHIPYKKSSLSRSNCMRNALGLVCYVAATALIAYQAIIIVGVSTLQTSNSGADTKTPAQRYDWATQWSLPKAETWSLIACDYHGASSRSQSSPYWGGMGRSEGWETTKQGFRNFRLAGYALGSLPFVFISFLIVYLITCRKNSLFDESRKKIIFVSIGMAAICLMLAWGKHFPLYRLFYSLPRMSAIRNPDKWLGPFTLFFGIIFAHSMDSLLYCSDKCSDADRKKMSSNFIRASIFIPLIASLTLLYIITASGVFISDLQSAGYGKTAENAWRNAIQADAVALVISLLCIAAIWFFSAKRKISSNKTRLVLVVVATLLMSFELGRAALPFVISSPYGHLSETNALTNYLDKNIHKGRIKLMPPQHPLLNNWRMSYVMAKGYSIYDPISIREMPSDLQQFLNAFAQNPLRLWQIGSIRHFICSPEAARQLSAIKSGDQNLFVKRMELSVWQTKSGALIPIPASATNKKYLEVLEFLPALPPFRFVQDWTHVSDDPDGNKAVLADMIRPDYNPATSTHLHDKKAAPSGKGGTGNVNIIQSVATETTLQTSLTEDGLLLHSEKYHPDWNVYIDGKPAKLVRADYIFQAVAIPAGSHKVVFRYEPSTHPLVVSVASRITLIILLLGVGVLSFRSNAATGKPNHDK